ncbi:MAG TPA: LuxR C-terminal-related transcriptional regulator, partial [Promineifilum sp.]|nr:LuxR C-terminal-related transcriptional regulator [Promineifilum sp.]
MAADVLERAIQEVSTWSRGDVSRLTGWLDMLPDSILVTRPTLSLHASRALYLSGQMERAEVLLHQAEQSLRDLDEGGLKAVAMVYRAAMSAMRGEDPAAAATMMRRLLDHPETMNIHTAARAADTLGLACELVGDVAAAEQAYRQAADLAQAAGVAYLAINARCECALVQITRGQLDSAEAMCRLALDSTSEETLPPTGLAWSILGEIARERNDPATAEKLIPLGIEIARKGGIVDDLRHALLFLVRLRQAQEDWTAARTAWAEVDTLLRAYNIPRLIDLSAAYRARLDLAQGYITSAGHWARHYQELRTSRADAYLREFEDLTLIRVLIAENKADEAMRWLRPLTTSAREAGRNRTVIEACILQAGILAGSDVPAACVALGDALALAADAGFRQLFIDEGPSISPLLAKTRHIAPAFVDSLALPQSHAKADSLSDDTPTDLLTRQPLSPRELDVLRLLAAGLSNQEIAATLVITVGTAKWHVHNIFEKLGARGRTQAVARAREQGL